MLNVDRVYESARGARVRVRVCACVCARACVWVHAHCADVQMPIRCRFTADLVNANVVLPGSLVSLFEALLVPLEELPQTRADAYARLVLCALPWVARDLNERNTAALTSLMAQLDAYIK